MQVLAPNTNEKLVMYADGGCRNSGDKVGAYSYVIVKMAVSHNILSEVKVGMEVFGGASRVGGTTNNIMEMLAVKEGIEHCAKVRVTPDIIVTDSQYVQKGMTEWSPKWIRNNWKTSTGQTVSNLQLWIDLLKVWSPNDTKVVHIRGHRGVYWNEICDKRCTYFMDNPV